MTALYGFAYTEAALKYLAMVSPKIRSQIKSKVEMLATNPYPPKSKKLHGITENDDPVYRIRSGDYRILYLVRTNPDQVIILDIDNRKGVYR